MDAASKAPFTPDLPLAAWMAEAYMLPRLTDVTSAIGLCDADIEIGFPLRILEATYPDPFAFRLHIYLSTKNPGCSTPPSMKARCKAYPAALAAAVFAKNEAPLISTTFTDNPLLPVPIL
ncbi:MAG: hypothetical protein BWY04_00472 [candidate division CPR1 bacterium ADurb.Bin160]|uniref:Uncharacterized protein n=1 Tax=candidate division CPR1 bacterium ADurb.Bin160 TaxID=1852826 RepID=A0A1V5ZPJ6_9BACT|nr:MAG: hypothetical protein BWY04_00472 [candidate division CPR1 bacterium ADurb.Bin160]